MPYTAQAVPVDAVRRPVTTTILSSLLSEISLLFCSVLVSGCSFRFAFVPRMVAWLGRERPAMRVLEGRKESA